ncbi:MAG: NAD(P)H-dependent glycerol-3-phosphate dehydrogenase [Actinomycetota bacterium]
MSAKVAVLGSGSWGTAFAAVVARNGVPTTLWARRTDAAQEIELRHTNESYLPGIELPAMLGATTDMQEAVHQAELVVMGVPSDGFRDRCQEVAPMLKPDAVLVSLCKGIERASGRRMSQVAAEAAGLPAERVAVISGPNLAKEVARGLPGATVAASVSEETARKVQALCHAPTFRVYTNTDVIGVEVGGAVKNIAAIAAGVADGYGYGENALSALVTRGLVEITRLGVALGANPITFVGLAGVGDLVATCMSKLSRNHHVGEELSKGRRLDDIIQSMNQVAEGVKSCGAILETAAELGVEMPIAERVGKVLYEGADVKDMVDSLLTRDPETEFRGIPN